MQLALFVFIIGIINVAIGYGLAICLGHGPPLWQGTPMRLGGLNRSSPTTAYATMEARVAQTTAPSFAPTNEPGQTHVPGLPEESPAIDSTVPARPNPLAELRAEVVAAHSRLNAVQAQLQNSERNDDSDGVDYSFLTSRVGELKTGTRITTVPFQTESSSGCESFPQEKREKKACRTDACRHQLDTLCQELQERLKHFLDAGISSNVGGNDDAARDEQLEALSLDQLAQLETTTSNLRHKHAGLAPPLMTDELLKELDRLCRGYEKLAECLP